MMLSATEAISSQIERAIKDIPGWSPLDQLLTLFTLAYSSGSMDGDIIELGSWCGRSAVVLGLAAQLTGNTKVHCIDLFPEKDDWYENPDGTYSFSVSLNGKKYNAFQDQTLWAEPFHRDIAPVYERFSGTLEAFNNSIIRNTLTERVMAYRSDIESFSAAAPNDLAVRLAFIDGDHSFDAVCKDIDIIDRFLLPGGWVCFDDAFSVYDGVDRAIQDRIIESGRYSMFQKMTRKFFVAQKR